MAISRSSIPKQLVKGKLKKKPSKMTKTRKSSPNKKPIMKKSKTLNTKVRKSKK